jgi:hypothetical protein
MSFVIHDYGSDFAENILEFMHSLSDSWSQFHSGGSHFVATGEVHIVPMQIDTYIIWMDLFFHCTALTATKVDVGREQEISSNGSRRYCSWLLLANGVSFCWKRRMSSYSPLLGNNPSEVQIRICSHTRKTDPYSQSRHHLLAAVWAKKQFQCELPRI